MGILPPESQETTRLSLQRNRRRVAGGARMGGGGDEIGGRSPLLGGERTRSDFAWEFGRWSFQGAYTIC